MTKKILFIEDESDFVEVVASYLRGRSFDVTSVSSGREGLRELKKNSYDLVILDLGLPDINGLEICKKIRESEGLPIIILSARDEIFQKVTGFDAGADDYLVKPASLRELVERINRLLERNLKDNFRSSVFEFDGIKFNTVEGTLTSSSRSVKLTKKEKAVLEYLLVRKGRVLTRIEIMDHVWGEDIDMLSNTVNMVISSLRRKLRQLSRREFIQSVHGLGYKFEMNGIKNYD